MRFIAHRGNIEGPRNTENTKDYILSALNAGYDVEMDVTLRDDQLWLGHDTPQQVVDVNFLKNDKFWVHCKSVKTFHYLYNYGINCFFHKDDLMTVTSKGYIWLHSDCSHIDLIPHCLSIANLTYLNKEVLKRFKNIFGICSDYAKWFKDYYSFRSDS